jgi:hypothetical protein
MERTRIIMEIRVRIIPDTMVNADSIPVRALIILFGHKDLTALFTNLEFGQKTVNAHTHYEPGFSIL